MITTRRVAIVATALLALIVAFQVALAAGAPWGNAAYGGQPAHLNASFRVSSVIAAVFWAGAALVVLRRVGYRVWAPLPARALPVAVWVLFALSLISVIMNGITPSSIERAIWLPFAIVLASALGYIAIASRRAQQPAR
jgi:hypothetical protein